MNSDVYTQQLLEYAALRRDKLLIKNGNPIASKKPIYVMYARKSTKGKKKQEKSIPDQIKECNLLCKREQIVPIQTFREEQTAKIPGKRDVFAEMITGLKKGRYNAIVAWHPDRLARNMKDAGEIIDLLDKGVIVDLKFASYVFNNDGNGKMALGIQFVIAKNFSDTLSSSSLRGTRNRALEGKCPTRTKQGYKLSKNRYFRPDGENFILIKKAFEMASQSISYEAIAEYLNAHAYRYENRVNIMTKQKVSNFLQDPFYAGLFIYNDSIVVMRDKDPDFVQMLTAEEFVQVRRLIDKSKTFKKKASHRTIPFRGQVICGYCKKIMSPGTPTGGPANNKKRYLTIRCNNRLCKSRLDENLKRELRGYVIFDYIDKVVEKWEIDDSIYDEYVKGIKLRYQIERPEILQRFKVLNRKLAEQEKEFDDLNKVIVRTPEEKLKTVKKLEQKRDKLVEDIDMLKDVSHQLQMKLIDLDTFVKTSTKPKQEFMNFIKNIGNTIKTNDNPLLVDKLIKMMFLNFTVKNKIVVSHQLKPEFEKYIKHPVVQYSAEDRT